MQKTNPKYCYCLKYCDGGQRRPKILFGYCHCGICNRKTEIAKRTRSILGHIKGQPIPYIFNHHSKLFDVPVNIPVPIRPDIPRGYCYDGCGKKTELSKRADPKRGLRRGEPNYYIRFHHRRSSAVECIEEDRGYKTPCWIWQRAINKKTGYGCTTNGRKDAQLAHVVYYEDKYGPVPKGKILHHRCEIKRCVNPDHLEPLRQQVHVQIGKKAKLDGDSVREIRELRAGGMVYREIRERFPHVGLTAIQNAAKGTSWDNVDAPPAPLIRR